MTMATMTMKMMSSLYSLIKNAFAPCWILMEMEFIFSDPGSWRRTQLPRYAATMMPITAQAGAIHAIAVVTSLILS